VHGLAGAGETQQLSIAKAGGGGGGTGMPLSVALSLYLVNHILMMTASHKVLPHFTTQSPRRCCWEPPHPLHRLCV
jgi:hypothetical protein